MEKLKFVIKRSGAKVKFKPERITHAIYRAAVAVGGRDKEPAKKLSEKVIKNLQKNKKKGKIFHVEEIQDIVEKTLIKNGHDQVAKAYILYRDERKRIRDRKNRKQSAPSEKIPWFKLWQILDWAVSHDLHTIGSLNKRIKNKEFPHIVHESEEIYEEQVDVAARLIKQNKDNLKIVIISGPSSSGKTTTTIKIEQHLHKEDLKFVTLNVDNYFYDIELHPKDEFGDYDFETPQALDINLINEHIFKLCEGEEVLIPYYDFKSGKRHMNHTSMRLSENEILLIDSLHGLYPEMTKHIEDEQKFKLYLEPLIQMKNNKGEYLKWTDLRMIRRMLRDYLHRAYNPGQTLEHWHYVRSSELRNIIPFINTANYIINTAMPYEIALYSFRLLEDFIRWEKKYEGDPLKEDAYRRAKRIKEILEEVEPVRDDSAVPPSSILREFIGGSCFKY